MIWTKKCPVCKSKFDGFISEDTMNTHYKTGFGVGRDYHPFSYWCPQKCFRISNRKFYSFSVRIAPNQKYELKYRYTDGWLDKVLCLVEVYLLILKQRRGDKYEGDIVMEALEKTL